MDSRAWVLLLHLLLLHVASAAQTPIQVFTRKLQVDKDVKLVTISNRQPGEGNIHPYAICERGHEKHCTVVYEYYRPDGLTTVNKCHASFFTNVETDSIQLHSARNGRMIFSYTDNVAFYRDRIDAYQTFRVIEVSTCRQHEARIHVKNAKPQGEKRRFLEAGFQQQVLQHDDGSFDVFLLYPDACDAARCRYSFDSEGRQIGDRISYLSPELSYEEIAMLPIRYMPKNYFAVVSAPRSTNLLGRRRAVDLSVRVLYAKAMAKSEQLLSFESEALYDLDAARSRLGLCWTELPNDSRYVARINCRLFGSDMWHLTSTAFQLPRNVTAVSVKNLPGDEMVLLTREASRPPYHDFHLRRIRSDGRLGEDLEISGFDCDDGENVCMDQRMMILSADERFVCLLCVCRYREKERITRWCYETSDL